MSGKYVPPSRREGYTPKTTDTPPWVRLPKPQFRSYIKQDFQLLEQIFQTPQQGTYNYYLYPNPSQPILAYDPTRTPENTPLPPSAPSHPLGDLICYIMIFPRAHPLWEEGGELWHHTASETLAGDWKGDKKNFGSPIPVFCTSSMGMKGKVHCLGWWTINALREVEPHSEELIDLLETKERFRAYGSGRTKAQWHDALSDRWIKTRLTPVEDTHPMFGEMVDPVTLGLASTEPEGAGEGGRLVLKVGGMEEELQVLHASHQPGGMPSDRECGSL